MFIWLFKQLSFAEWINTYCSFFQILLLFIGIIKKSTTMVLPHLVVQGICLLFSLAYFFLYAWSYVYGDLYVQNNEFRVRFFVQFQHLNVVDRKVTELAVR